MAAQARANCGWSAISLVHYALGAASRRQCGGAGAQLMLTFSPTLIDLSSEVRAYILAFLFLSTSLVFLEKALDHSRMGYMIWFHVFLYLAILTEYCVAWYAAALGVYAMLRLWKKSCVWRHSGDLGTRASGRIEPVPILYFAYLSRSSSDVGGMYSVWLQGLSHNSTKTF